MFKEEQLTRNIIGLAMRAHRELGPGFKENIYHKAMLHILKANKYSVLTEKPFKVYMDKNEIGSFRIDLMVNSKVIIEIKAVGGKMPQIFQSQLVSYLKASGLELGLLLNFGNPSLEFKRVVHYKNHQRLI